MKSQDASPRKLYLTTLVASLSICGVLAGPAAAVNIGFDPDSQSVVFGSSLEVDIVFSNLGGEIVSAYDLDITYDSSVLDATGVIFTTALGDELFFEVFSDAVLSTPGIVDPFQLSLLSDPELLAIQGGGVLG